MRENAPLRDLPLVTDLDGTLIHSDLLQESLIGWLRGNPLRLLLIPLLLLQGRAALKERVARDSDLDIASLPYNQALLTQLREQREAGRRLVLCTAASEQLARRVADHLALFDEVIGSDGQTNIKGARKAEALVQRFGENGFDYAGDAQADLPVWEAAAGAIVVNADDALLAQARERAEVLAQFPRAAVSPQTWLRQLRVQQWLKNLLLFAPVLAAHQALDAGTALSLLAAFLSFSLAASGTYLINDLLDLESDRLHPRKRLRPLANGTSGYVRENSFVVHD